MGSAIAPLAALFTGDNMIPLSEFPAIDATLNATSALLLTLGYFFIRRKRIQAHKVCMLSAFATSSLFLVCYIWYHAHHGVTRFARQGAVRDLYLALLGSHTILAVVIVPLILTTLYRALRGRFERHKKIARWTSLSGSTSLLPGLSSTGCCTTCTHRLPRVRVCATRQKLRSGCPFPLTGKFRPLGQRALQGIRLWQSALNVKAMRF